MISKTPIGAFGPKLPQGFSNNNPVLDIWLGLFKLSWNRISLVRLG